MKSSTTPRRALPAAHGGRATGALLLAAAIALAAGSAQAEWKGEKVTEGGVVHVKSPAAPAEPEMLTVTPQEIWRLGGDTDSDDEFFGVINQVLLDEENNLYVLDNQLSEVKVYDADGAFLRTLGREGEGPGEFRRPSDMFFMPDGNLGVMQLFPGRIVLLTRGGDPAGDFPLPTDASGSAPIMRRGSLLGSNIALHAAANKFEEGKFTQTNYIVLIDAKGSEVTRIYSEDRIWEQANPVFAEKMWDTFDRRWSVGQDGRLFLVTGHNEYAIQVFDAKGKKTLVMERAYKPLERDAAEMERIKGIWSAFTRQAPRSEFKIESTYKDVESMYPRVDGSLWVLTSRGQKERPSGSIGVFDVFNRDGQFVRQVSVKAEGNPDEDAYFLVKDRLYVVTGFLSAAMAAAGGGDEEDVAEEPEPMSVICYKLDVPDMGM